MEPCPICGTPVRTGWLEIHVEREHGLPALIGALASGPSVVRVYHSMSAPDAQARFTAEAALFAIHGYRPVEQHRDSSDTAAQDYLVYGPTSFVLDRTPRLTVTFARVAEPSR